MINRTQLISVLLSATCIPCCSVAFAAPQDGGDHNTGRISLDLGVDITSAYYFRGYLQEDSGFIAQPHAEVGFALKEADGDDDYSIDAFIGNWNSFHSEHTGAVGTGHESWYESDIYGGFAVGWDIFEFGVGYTFYTYPNNSTFDTVQEVGITIGVDLADDEWYGQWFGDLGFGFYIETDNSNVGMEEAAYFQFDFGPSFEVFDGAATFSVPMALGLSLDDYYVGADDDTFGFFSVGAVIEVPLSSSDFGDLTLTGGANVLFFGDTTETSSGDDVDAYGFIGLSLSY